MGDYAEDLERSVESEFIERQHLPSCAMCGDVTSYLVDGYCEPCQTAREYDAHIDHLIDMERER